jgi:hypothetical protein
VFILLSNAEPQISLNILSCEPNQVFHFNASVIINILFHQFTYKQIPYHCLQAIVTLSCFTIVNIDFISLAEQGRDNNKNITTARDILNHLVTSPLAVFPRALYTQWLASEGEELHQPLRHIDFPILYMSIKPMGSPSTGTQSPEQSRGASTPTPTTTTTQPSQESDTPETIIPEDSPILSTTTGNHRRPAPLEWHQDNLYPSFDDEDWEGADTASYAPSIPVTVSTIKAGGGTQRNPRWRSRTRPTTAP